ncbi:MAG: NAD(P)H-quinone oxidoreductase, partial [Lentisphaeria bacterium]|nr:NAD(P)H-quinone oxidoreductase [Lentisphaeria bacterium]
MKAMILDEKLNFLWTDVPDPVRKADEVLIRVKAAAVNRADLMQKDGKYASPPDWPQWCGLEAAGEVVEAPEDSTFKPGDAVCALLGGGGYSELVTVPAGMVIPVPEGLSFVEAATLPEVWCTVYLNLQFEAGGVKAGDVFYIQAAASGVGLAAIQLAKFYRAKVIASVGSAEKAEIVKKFGADVVVNYKEEDILPVLTENPPDIALDCIAGSKMGACFKQMKFGGRWIMIASMAGGATEIDLETVWRKRLKLIGSTLRSRTSEEKSRIMAALKNELSPLFSQKKLISNIHAVFPIQEVEAAHAVLRRSENVGKVVLTF